MAVNETKSILWLTENYYPNTGGMAQSCDRIVQGLRDSGISIGLVHFRTAKSKLKLKIVRNGFNLSFPFSDDSGHSYNVLYDFLVNPAFQFKFSHIVAFGGYLPLLGTPVLSKLLSIPLHSLLRGNDLDLSLFAAKKREFLFYALQNSKTICTVSKEQLFKVQQLSNHTNIKYVPNGINLSDWQPLKSENERASSWKKEHVSEKKKVIGIFGHLKPKKGIEFFIDSIIRSGNSGDLFLLITGEIYPEIKAKLESAAIDYHISPFMDRFDLLAWYPICDAVAIPSFYDGMPNVLLEASALSIPIIASNIGGMKDILKDGENGFLFHPGDEEGCANSIRRFVEADNVFLQDMGKKAQQIIELAYNHEIEIKQYLEIFQE